MTSLDEIGIAVISPAIVGIGILQHGSHGGFFGAATSRIMYVA